MQFQITEVLHTVQNNNLLLSGVKTYLGKDTNLNADSDHGIIGDKVKRFYSNWILWKKLVFDTIWQKGNVKTI